MPDGIGLSVGATNLTAVVVGRTALMRTPVVTRYPHRPPEVGVPSENPNLTERGLIITDFVDRVGDPVPIVAPDGSTHLGEAVLADALQALWRTVAAAGPPGEPVGISHPAHWQPAAVEALRARLGAVPELATATVLSDAAAATTALEHDPGLPTDGIIALCDFGGTGTSFTLVDAAGGYRPVAPTTRYAELSGALIDQALLHHVLADLTAADALDLSGTSAIGSLSRLRAQCRTAKERLSTAAATTLTADLPDGPRELRLTRDELDAVLRQPLDEALTALRDTMDRNGIRPADLSAVATLGGGARIPLITTALSERFRVPVVTTAQPELTAAIGAGVSAARSRASGPLGADDTQLGPAAAAAAVGTPDQADTQWWDGAAPAADEPAAAAPALAWSQADDIPAVYPSEPVDAAAARPDIGFDDPEPVETAEPPLPWHRRPQVLFAAAVVAVLTASTVALFTLRDDDTPVPASTTEAPPTTAEAPPPPEDPPAPQAPPAPPQTVYRTAPPPQTQAPPPPPEPTEEPPETSEPPPETTEEPSPETTEPPPETTEPPPETTAPPETTEAPTTTRPRWLPTIPRPTLPTIPGWPPPADGS